MTNVVSCNDAVTSDRSSWVKARQQAMWESGDYAVIGATLQIVGELLNEAADVRATDRVLDAAAGSGNATLAAARRFASVTSTDYVPALLERGRRRAEAEGFDNITFEVADVEALPYQDASFDVVLSTFGVMFAPNHERAAGELMRVCRPGGRIGLASWTPSGFLGQLFRVIGEYVSAHPGSSLSSLVGDRCSPSGAVRGRDEDRAYDADVRVPLSIAGTLGRRVSRLLWARSQDLRRPRRGPSGRARIRPDRAPLLSEPGRGVRHGGTRRVLGDRDREMNGRVRWVPGTRRG